VKDLVAPLPGFSVGLRRHWFAATAALPLVVLGLAQVLPTHGPGAAIRLAAAATVVLLVPGAFVVRALGAPPDLGVAVAAALAWSLVLLFGALLVTFAVGGSLTLALVLLAAATLAAAVGALRHESPAVGRADLVAVLGVTLASLPLAAAAWFVHRTATGDALFHVAYVRKLEELATLDSLESVGQVADGGLHPGYAFPLWHGALAAVARLAGIDAADAVIRLGPVLTPLFVLVAYGAGAALFRSWAGGVALAAGATGIAALTGERLGALEVLSDPEGAARHLLVPALLALVFWYARGGGPPALACVAAASFALAVVHPNYAPYAALVLGGCLVGRLALVRRVPGDVAALGISIAVLALATAAFAAWLWPAVADTASVTAGAAETARDLARYPGVFDGTADSFSVDPAAITRRGGLVVAALVAVPLAGFAGRRLWAALVLGGSLAVLAVLLVAPLLTLLADLASVSQARRLVGFLPLPFALAGAAVLAGRFRLAGVAAALAAGAVVRWAFPPESGTGPGAEWPVWVAAGGGALALAVAAWRRPEGPRVTAWAAAAAVALVAPSAIATLRDLEQEPLDGFALSGGLVQALRSSVGTEDVVMAKPETAYRVSAEVPTLVVSLPIAHIADTETARPRERLRDTETFFSPESSAADRHEILERYDARWLVLDKRRSYSREFRTYAQTLAPVYEDGRFLLLRTGAS
jgi:hypothetical protein